MPEKTGGLARNTDPQTSHDAADSITANQIELEVCNALAVGPSTTEEIANRLGRDLQSITPRMRPLENKGYVMRTQFTRPGKSGRERIVWQRTPRRTP
jgi:predicted transcriptional regulator